MNDANDEALLVLYLLHCRPFCVFDLIPKEVAAGLVVGGFVGFGWGQFGGHPEDQGGRARCRNEGVTYGS